MYSTPEQLLTYWLTIGMPTFIAVIVPAVLALAAAVYDRHYFKDRRVQLSILVLIVINILFTVPQFVFQLEGVVTRLLPAYILVIVFLYRQLGVRTSAPVAFATTWFTLIIPDVLSVVGHHIVLHGGPAHIWTAFAWVGGAGFADALILFPLATALLAVVTPWVVDAIRPQPQEIDVPMVTV